MWFRNKTKPVSFEDTRRVLLVVLTDVDEQFWREKLASVSRTSFKSLLGGMGSFNDLTICVENKHRIANDKQPLANELLECLREVCSVTAQSGILKAVDADAVCDTQQSILHGWRCLACGYAQASHYNIRGFVAAVGVRVALRKGMDDVLSLWKNEEDTKALNQTISIIRKSGIQTAKDDGWMRPCPACKGDDTCVYRWQFNNGSFFPTSHNLPLKTKAN